jgi:hypothetical protein
MSDIPRDDATQWLQKQIRVGGRVTIPHPGYPIITGPIRLVSDLHLVFEPGCIVQAKEGEFLGNRDCLFSAINCRAISIKGNGVRFEMRKDLYQLPPYEPGEWRHCLMFRGCNIVRVTGITCFDSGGDGICLGSHEGQTNQTVLIKDCHCLNNYRNGLTVGSADCLMVCDCCFSNTAGTAPNTGVVLEPNNASEQLTDIRFHDCLAANNIGNGFLVDLHKLRATSQRVDIKFTHCMSLSNRWYGTAVRVGLGHPVGGQVIFKDCKRFNDTRGPQRLIDNELGTVNVMF